ncbi:MAG: hypothetical protein K8R69_08420, partial [Deltaproteobacteria bacterium]|nr:hypothetical protein [Deltaproteobacteria bacterium]
INCIHVMPDLHKLEGEFGKDLTVVGVHSGKFDNERDVENIRAAVLRYEIAHPVVNDADFKIWNSFGVNSWPTLVLLNPEGGVDQVYSGEGHYEDLRGDILRLKKEYAGRLREDPLPIALEKDKTPPSLLAFPGKLAFAPDLNRIFVSDSGHHRILGFQPDGTVMTVIGKEGESGWKDGSFPEARFHRPQGLLYADKKLYVADTENHLLRLVDLEAGKVTTLAGTGKQGFERNPKNASALMTALSNPWDLAFFPSGKIAMAMAGTHQLWAYDLANRTLSVLAGNGRESIDDGAYPDNSLSQPSGLSAWDKRLYFVDSETSSLRVVEDTPQKKSAYPEVKTLIGTGLFDFGFKDGKQGVARMQHPLGLLAEASGVFVADAYNHSIRWYDTATQLLSTFAGDGKRGREDGALASARFNEPNAVIRVGDRLFVADTNNQAIRVIDTVSKSVSTLVLRMPQESEGVKPSEKLPNLKIQEKWTLAPGQAIGLTLKLPEGWKVNAEAPSSLRLFQIKPEGASLVRAFPRSEILTKAVAIPALAAGGTYLLQGTIYYCREGKDALCFLMSAEGRILVQEGGAKSIEWSVGEKN